MITYLIFLGRIVRHIMCFRIQTDHQLFLEFQAKTMISTFVLCSVLVVVAQTAVLSARNNAAFETRIINGQLAQPNQLPWHAVIEGTHQNGNRTFCGGAIISPTFVLTAAHCIFGTT